MAGQPWLPERPNLPPSRKAAFLFELKEKFLGPESGNLVPLRVIGLFLSEVRTVELLRDPPFHSGC